VSIVGYWPGTVALGIVLVFLIRHCLVLNIFLFPVRTAIIIGKARRGGVRGLPIRLLPFCSANTIGAAIHTLPIGEAQ
jgi:hypothetical protein